MRPWPRNGPGCRTLARIGGAAQGALTDSLANLLGLPPGIPVAAGLPSAHAGLLGAIGRAAARRADGTAVLVAGEQTTLLMLSAEQREPPGIDGPFTDLPFPGLHLYSAAQECAGAAQPAPADGLALQLRELVGHCEAHGFAISRICLAGPHGSDAERVRLYRDALGGLVVSDIQEPVLLGAAMAAAVAAGLHPSLAVAVDLMAPPQSRLEPDPLWRADSGPAR